MLLPEHSEVALIIWGLTYYTSRHLNIFSSVALGGLPTKQPVVTKTKPHILYLQGPWTLTTKLSDRWIIFNAKFKNTIVAKMFRKKNADTPSTSTISTAISTTKSLKNSLRKELLFPLEPFSTLPNYE